jgi:hypothetical protein
MAHNPILDELRDAREKLLADAGGDLAQLVDEIRERQTKSGHKVITGRVDESRNTEGRADTTASTGVLP